MLLPIKLAEVFWPGDCGEKKAATLFLPSLPLPSPPENQPYTAGVLLHNQFACSLRFLPEKTTSITQTPITLQLSHPQARFSWDRPPLATIHWCPWGCPLPGSLLRELWNYIPRFSRSHLLIRWSKAKESSTGSQGRLQQPFGDSILQVYSTFPSDSTGWSILAVIVIKVNWIWVCRLLSNWRHLYQGDGDSDHVTSRKVERVVTLIWYYPMIAGKCWYLWYKS